MGTRADFYVGEGPTAEWLGSVAWDGYEWEEDESMVSIKTPEGFKTKVEEILTEREDATRPEQGWPWPWDDSNTTDYAYSFIDGKVHIYIFGRSEGSEVKNANFPDMSDKKNLTLGKRSGVIVIGA